MERTLGPPGSGDPACRRSHPQGSDLRPTSKLCAEVSAVRMGVRPGSPNRCAVPGESICGAVGPTPTPPPPTARGGSGLAGLEVTPLLGGPALSQEPDQGRCWLLASRPVCCCGRPADPRGTPRAYSAAPGHYRAAERACGSVWGPMAGGSPGPAALPPRARPLVGLPHDIAPLRPTASLGGLRHLELGFLWFGARST